jgi:carotenoid cleavage dioxygenase-like enzyme
LPDGGSERRLLGSYKTDRPSYMHSFGLSQKYVVLMEFPLGVNPLSMLLRGKPFITNYTWSPSAVRASPLLIARRAKSGMRILTKRGLAFTTLIQLIATAK